jgi:hypothetical protein
MRQGIFSALLCLAPILSNGAVVFGPTRVLPNGSIQLQLSVVSGKSYMVEASSDLQHWAELLTVAADKTDLVVTDSNAANLSQRFYRAGEAVPRQRPGNDNFEARAALPGSEVAVAGGNAGANLQAGEPDHAYFDRGGKSVWWTWTAPAGGMVTVSTIGTYFDTLIAVYSGSSVSSLQTVAKKPYATRLIQFEAVAGRSYEIAIDGNAASEGGIDLALVRRDMTTGTAPANLSDLRVNMLETSDPNLAPRVIQFSGDGKKWVETVNGDGKIIESGNVVLYEPNGANATLKLEGIRENETLEYDYVLSFNSATAGKYSYNLFGQPFGSGTFNDFRNGKSSLAPSSLAGRSMFTVRATSTSGGEGQTHFFAFGLSGRFHDSDGAEHGTGNFSYSPDGSKATLVLDYTGSVDFSGDKATMELTFTTTTEGTFTSKYRRNDGAEATITGPFVIDYQ